jgi:hypothetical protein
MENKNKLLEICKSIFIISEQNLTYIFDEIKTTPCNDFHISKFLVTKLIKKWIGEFGFVKDVTFATFCFYNLVYNTTLWIFEDKARKTSSSDTIIAAAKRQIDINNQLRHEAIENVDELIFTKYLTKVNPSSPIFSETPGSIIDRIHILLLKQKHYGNLLSNKNYNTPSARARLVIIKSQLVNIKSAIEFEIQQTQEQKMHFRVHKELKAYNEKRFNPALEN